MMFQVIWWIMLLYKNFFCSPYLHAHLLFQISHKIITGVIWISISWTWLFALWLHQLLRCALDCCLWFVMPRALPKYFQSWVDISLSKNRWCVVSVLAFLQQWHFVSSPSPLYCLLNFLKLSSIGRFPFITLQAKNDILKGTFLFQHILVSLSFSLIALHISHADLLENKPVLVIFQMEKSFLLLLPILMDSIWWTISVGNKFLSLSVCQLPLLMKASTFSQPDFVTFSK